MNTDLLHKYFKGETTEQEESLIVEWVEESAENKARYLKERMLYDVSLFSDTTTGKKIPNCKELKSICHSSHVIKLSLESL